MGHIELLQSKNLFRVTDFPPPVKAGIATMAMHLRVFGLLSLVLLYQCPATAFVPHVSPVPFGVRRATRALWSTTPVSRPGFASGAAVWAKDTPRHSFLSLRGSMSPEEPLSEGSEEYESTGTDAGSKGVAFREGDAQLFLDMAKAEEAQGNATGAETYRFMADKLEQIMEQKPPTQGTSKKPVKEEEAASDPNPWPYVHKDLSVSGSKIERTEAGSTPSGARTRAAFSPGDVVATWEVKLGERKGPISIGLTSLMVDLDSEWTDPRNTNKAFFLTQSGTLYNGDQLIFSSGTSLQTGDVVSITLDGDTLSFGVNGADLPGEIKPVSGSLRLSISLRTQGDSAALLSQEVREFAVSEGESYGTTTLSRSSIDEEDDVSLLDGVLQVSRSEGASAPVLPEPAPAPVPKKSPWKMEVDQESGAVYYWNTKTQETTWERPEGFVGGSEKAFLDEEKKAGRLLEKTEEKKEGVMFDNDDASKDSHQSVKFDADGLPAVDKFVYVDEQTCIGCTNCATVARSTFYMAPEHGRARAFRQGGDADPVIEEAIATCPVDCIWYVSWDDLVVLETERREQVINPFQRLVGGSFIEASQNVGMYGRKTGGGQSKASIMNSGAMRCNNCPGRGCKLCPLYGVGENPEFMRKKAARDRKRALKKAGNLDGGVSLKLSDDGFMNEEAALNSLNTWDSDSFTDSSELTGTESIDDKSI